jgi:hypothetical protein
MSLEELLPPNQQKYSTIIMLRSSLVMSTLLIALSVPFFGKCIVFNPTKISNRDTILIICILPFDRTCDGPGWFLVCHACGKIFMFSSDILAYKLVSLKYVFVVDLYSSLRMFFGNPQDKSGVASGMKIVQIFPILCSILSSL